MRTACERQSLGTSQKDELRNAKTVGCALGLLLAWATPAQAQHEHHTPPAGPGWNWRIDAQAFVNYNIQERKFRDFHVLESQNWFMTTGAKEAGRGRFSLHGMISFEPWTMKDIGSSQVFQTGETFQGAALVDYQHPHDFVMEAAARFEWPLTTGWRLHFYGGPVGSPAIGPPVFMHRPSSEANPTAPLAHHYLDSTHVTHGVVTVGVTRGQFTAEGSAFHGREPDEDRVAIEFGPIDSYSARIRWRKGPWDAQVSAAHLKYPDPTELSDHDLITASLAFTGELFDRPLAMMGAYGYIKEPGTGRNMPAGLIEGTWQQSPRDLFYTRGELMVKDVLTRGGFHPPGFTHPHILSTIGALTLGYERRISNTRAGHFGVGGDATVYYRDVNLYDGYGDPFSAHIFLRYKFPSR